MSCLLHTRALRRRIGGLALGSLLRISLRPGLEVVEPVADLGDGFLLDPADLGAVDDFWPGPVNVGLVSDVVGDLVFTSVWLDLGEAELLVTLVPEVGDDLVVTSVGLDFGEVELLVTLVLGGVLLVWF